MDTTRLAKLGVAGPKAQWLSEEIETVRRVVTSNDAHSSGDRYHRGWMMPDWLHAILCERGPGVDRGRPPPIRWADAREATTSTLREAKFRIARLMEGHRIEFNGAGEQDLPSAEQAWNVEHTVSQDPLPSRSSPRPPQNLCYLTSTST